MENITAAKEKFGALIEAQKKRVAAMRAQGDFVDYAALPQIVISVCGGDGIGPTITHEAERVLRFLLKDEVERGKVAFKEIDGLTIENRAAHMKAIPDDVLAELKACHVILKGPTTTPRAGDEWPNIESANVAMRKELDLFANVRPVKVPGKASTGRSSVRTPRARTPWAAAASRPRTASLWISPSLPLTARSALQSLRMILPGKTTKPACPSLPKPTSSRPRTASF